MAKEGFIKTWLRDWWDIFCHELRQIFSDGGVLLIFFVAGLAYPLLYNVVYLNGVLSDTPVGSPIVDHPNVLMVMNAPSLDKYENAVKEGGCIFLDSTLITREVERKDVKVYRVPATQMANDMGMAGLANMILLGAVIAETGCISEEGIPDALKKVIPARKMNLLEANLKALEAGREYVKG